MNEIVFVIRNQNDQYLEKKHGWQSGKDAAALYFTAHHDEALNTLLEINSKDIELRGYIIEVDKDDKKRPIVEVSEAAIELDRIAKENAAAKLLDPASYKRLEQEAPE